LQHIATYGGHNLARPRSNPADVTLSYFAGILIKQMLPFYADFELTV